MDGRFHQGTPVKLGSYYNGQDFDQHIVRQPIRFQASDKIFFTQSSCLNQE